MGQRTTQAWTWRTYKGKAFQGGRCLAGGATAFINFDLATLGGQLISRVLDYTGIDQGSSALCGVAALMFAFDRDSPAEYVKYVLDVALTRRGVVKLSTASNGIDVHVRKSSNILRAKSGESKIPEADYVAMASLRNSESIFPYRSNWTNGVLQGATTVNEVMKWLDEMGYSHCKDHTWPTRANWSLPGGRSRLKHHLVQANTAANADQAVLVYMAGAGVANYGIGDDSREQWYEKAFGGHFALLRGVTQDDKGATFNLVTWGFSSGDYHKAPWHMSWSKVEGSYRGYVCGVP